MPKGSDDLDVRVGRPARVQEATSGLAGLGRRAGVGPRHPAARPGVPEGLVERIVATLLPQGA
ncbi:hypothetical protein [Streptomyces sp. DSM 15324]|uniref:hypothetical protein n=1 Tax=Streptomyces sp. DSM 15324 TaxID=1739111 RepID=UPI00131DC436|nr:hypothetical protein [Streptomyces sp. DSM 15324]